MVGVGILPESTHDTGRILVPYGRASHAVDQKKLKRCHVNGTPWRFSWVTSTGAGNPIRLSAQSEQF
jgi:hypothetical protein